MRLTGNLKFYIYSKNFRELEGLSFNPSEQEVATIPETALKVLEKTRDAEGTWHIKMIGVSGDKLMPEHPELTPEDREALAQFDDFLASAGDAPPLAHPERFDHPIGLDEEGRKFAGDDDSPDEERSP